jgi:hypothetical protein
MPTTRNKAFKSPDPRLPNDAGSNFLQKLDPWFVGFARYFKENASQGVDHPKRARKAALVGKGSRPQSVNSPPAAVLPGWPRTVGEMLRLLAGSGDPGFAEAMKAIRERIPPEALATDLNQVLPNAVSLLKYQATVPELRAQEMQGHRNAGRKVVETADFYNRWMHEQLPRAGVRFKTNARHNVLMLYGLAGGLKRLSSRELGDFFDEFCPCGQTHTLEVLRRLRRKLVEALERGIEAIDSIATLS